MTPIGVNNSWQEIDVSDANGNSVPSTARAASRPPLRRPREGRVLAGVAAGIADHLGMDVAIVRLLIVVATFVTSGLGLLVYVAAIFVIPEADEQEEQVAEAARASQAATSEGGRDPAFWVGVALLVVGVLWVFGGVLGSVVVFPGRLFPEIFVRDLIWPLVLIGFGLALWKASDRRAAPPPGTPVAPPPPPRSGPAVGSGAATGAPPAGGAAYRPAADPGTPDAAVPGPQQTPEGEDLMTTQQTARPDVAPMGEDATDGVAPGTARFDAGSETVRLDAASGPAPTDHLDTEVAGRAGWGSDAWRGTGGEGGTPPPPGSTGQPTGGGGAWTPPEPRHRSLLTRLTLGAALVTVGVLWLLRVADVITFGTSRLVAAALLVVGIGLLVSTWFGRGRWLILVGGLLLPVVLAAELLRPYGFVDVPHADVRGGFGELHVTPADLDSLRSSYQIGAGSLRLDLSDLEIDAPTDLTVQVGAGEAWVYLPPDVTADVTGRVGVGELSIDGRTTSGLGVPERQQRIEHGEGSDLLTIEISVGFGEANVGVVPGRVTPPPSDDAGARSWDGSAVNTGEAALIGPVGAASLFDDELVLSR